MTNSPFFALWVSREMILGTNCHWLYTLALDLLKGYSHKGRGYNKGFQTQVEPIVPKTC